MTTPSTVPMGRVRLARLRPRRSRGFTLMETIVVIVMLGLVGAGLLAMVPQIRGTLEYGRDEFVGQELTRACAEKVLAARRNLGYAQVTSSLCNGLGGVGGFAANPSTFTMVSAAGASVSACTDATCTITVVFTKSSGPAAAIRPITLRLNYY